VFDPQLVPLCDDLQYFPPESLQELGELGIVGNDAFAAARKPVCAVVQFVEMDLTVHVALDDARRWYVLQDVALSQAPVHE
jgi:hypothetical protein